MPARGHDHADQSHRRVAGQKAPTERDDGEKTRELAFECRTQDQNGAGKRTRNPFRAPASLHPAVCPECSRATARLAAGARSVTSAPPKMPAALTATREGLQSPLMCRYIPVDVDQ